MSAATHEIHARIGGNAIDAGAPEMQYMPPGRNVIVPTIPGAEGEAPYAIAVVVDEGTARAMARRERPVPTRRVRAYGRR